MSHERLQFFTISPPLLSFKPNMHKLKKKKNPSPSELCEMTRNKPREKPWEEQQFCFRDPPRTNPMLIVFSLKHSPANSSK